MRQVHDRVTTVKSDQAALAWDQDWATPARERPGRPAAVRANCARCHTAGLVDVRPDGAAAISPAASTASARPPAAAVTGGGIGFNLRNNDEIRRFGDDASGGFAAQVDFVALGLGPGQGVRQQRHRLRPHARLREQDAHAGPDRRDRQLRALLPRHVDVLAAQPVCETGTEPRVRRPPRRRRQQRRRDDDDAHPHRRDRRGPGPPEPLEPDDPRRARRALGDRAVLRFGLPAARDQPRRPTRLPRRVRVAHRLHGAALHAVVDVGKQRYRPAARPLAVVEGRRGRAATRSSRRSRPCRHRRTTARPPPRSSSATCGPRWTPRS